MADKMYNLTNAARFARVLNEEYSLPRHVISGVIGNSFVESWNTPYGINGDQGSAHGMLQWRESRFEALKSFAQEHQSDWRLPEMQAHFMMHELKTTEPDAWEALQKSTTPKEAAVAMLHFERPFGYPEALKSGDFSGVAGYEKRVHWAEVAQAMGDDLFIGLRPKARGQASIEAATVRIGDSSAPTSSLRPVSRPDGLVDKSPAQEPFFLADAKPPVAFGADPKIPLSDQAEAEPPAAPPVVQAGFVGSMLRRWREGMYPNNGIMPATPRKNVDEFNRLGGTSGVDALREGKNAEAIDRGQMVGASHVAGVVMIPAKGYNVQHFSLDNTLAPETKESVLECIQGIGGVKLGAVPNAQGNQRVDMIYQAEEGVDVQECAPGLPKHLQTALPSKDGGGRTQG